MEEVSVLNSIRAKFTRGEEVKYISHLDLMKVFERALRRSRLPIAYSEGFNPHPKMVFGLPLPVGVTSEAEYGDFELSEHLEVSEFVRRLNEQLPDGIKIVDAQRKRAKGNVMALIRRASYKIYVCCRPGMGITQFKRVLDELMAKPSIIIEKRTKGGIKDTDIRPMIHKLVAEEADKLPKGCECEGNVYLIYALLSAGSRGNLKPELLVNALEHNTGEEIRPVKIHRTELFIEEEGRILTPFE